MSMRNKHIAAKWFLALYSIFSLILSFLFQPDKIKNIQIEQDVLRNILKGYII